MIKRKKTKIIVSFLASGVRIKEIILSQSVRLFSVPFLGLKELGLHSAVALTLGYRDAANDYLVNAKKVRRTHDKLVIKK